VIDPEGSFDIFGFFLPQSGDLVTFDVGQQVLFACPGAVLNVTATPEVVATCVDGSTFSLSDGSEHDFSLLGCTNLPFHTFRDTGRLCGRPDEVRQIIKLRFRIYLKHFY